MKKVWKDVVGYEGAYKVSNDGRVKRMSGYRAQVNRVLRGGTIKGGYKIVTLCKENALKRTVVHRLVAQAFIPNPDNKPFVNHIDANPNNNHVDNLEWCTQSENIRHAHKIGNMGGVKHAGAKLTEEDIYTIRLMYAWGESIKCLMERYKRKRFNIIQILKGEVYKYVSGGAISYFRAA